MPTGKAIPDMGEKEELYGFGVVIPMSVFLHGLSMAGMLHTYVVNISEKHVFHLQSCGVSTDSGSVCL